MVLGPQEGTLEKPVVPAGTSAHRFGFAPHSQVPLAWQQPPPVEQELSGPVSKVEHLQPAPPFEVWHVTVRHSHVVPPSGQSRSAQQTALGTTASVQVVVLVVTVPDGTAQRHDFPSLGLVHDVAGGGAVSPGGPGGPIAETLPHGLSHCSRRQWARASPAGEPDVG